MIKKQIKKFLQLLKDEKLTKLLAVLAISLAVIGTIVAIICIYVSRPIGDDFGAIVYYSPDVWLSNTIDSLKDTGRYGQSIFGSIAYGLLGNKIAVILPMVILFWIIYLIYLYAKKTLISYFKFENNVRIYSFFASILTTFLIIFVNNCIQYGYYPTWASFQNFFWPSGIVTYTFPLLLLLSSIYLIYIRTNSLSLAKKNIIFSVFVLATGLFNETQPATVFAISLFVILLSFIKPLKKLFRHSSTYITSSVASFLALILLFLSKGSQSRQSATGVSERENVIHSVLNGFKICLEKLYFRPKDLALILAVCILVAVFIKFVIYKKSTPDKNKINNGIVIGITITLISLGSLLCSLTLLFVGYGVEGYILQRTLLIPQISYVLGLLAFGSFLITKIICLKPFLLKPILLISLVSIICLMPTYLDKIILQLNSSLSYSNAWIIQEERIKIMKAEDKNSTIYFPQTVSGIGDGFSLSCVGSTWLNYQVAEYYEINKVCSELDLTQ